jgi:hypothetical protein
MLRKTFSALLVGLSSILFVASLVAIGLTWFYKEPLTRDGLSRLELIDGELEIAQTTLQEARAEIERTLRLVESAETTLSELESELSQARALFGEVDETLEGQLVPGLQGTREQINAAMNAVMEIRVFLQQVNEIPFVNLNLPGDELLAQIISVGFTLDQQIVGMEALAEKATLFLKDASYLMGGDFSTTRQNLLNFLAAITAYDEKLTEWRLQVADISLALPGWANTAAISLTVFLLWFAFSQFGLILHGVALWRGENPLRAFQRS